MMLARHRCFVRRDLLDDDVIYPRHAIPVWVIKYKERTDVGDIRIE
jgi:hypothetical protein